MRHRPKKKPPEVEAVLSKYRGSGNCEVCGKYCRNRAPHHVITKGAGGHNVDVNLVALGLSPIFDCQCHVKIHDTGRPSRMDLIDLVAQREGLERHVVLERIYRLIREKTQGKQP